MATPYGVIGCCVSYEVALDPKDDIAEATRYMGSRIGFTSVKTEEQAKAFEEAKVPGFTSDEGEHIFFVGRTFKDIGLRRARKAADIKAGFTDHPGEFAVGDLYTQPHYPPSRGGHVLKITQVHVDKEGNQLGVAYLILIGKHTVNPKNKYDYVYDENDLVDVYGYANGTASPGMNLNGWNRWK